MGCNPYTVPGAQTDTAFALSIEFVDELGAAIDMSGGTYDIKIYDAIGGTAKVVTFTTSFSGDGNEIISFTTTAAHGLAAGFYAVQVNRTDGTITPTWIASGRLTVSDVGGFSKFEITEAI